LISSRKSNMLYANIVPVKADFYPKKGKGCGLP
jgi:hypothetical protein